MYHASSVRSTLHFSVKLSLRLANQAHHSNTLSPKTALILTGDLVPPTVFFFLYSGWHFIQDFPIMADSKNKNTKKGKWLKGLITNYFENVRRKMLKCKYENSQYIKKIVVIVCSYITSLCRLMSLSYLSSAAVGSQDTRCFCLLWTLFFCFTENSVTSCSKEQTRKKTHTHSVYLCEPSRL